jgi:hypothetical protein
LCLIVVGIVIYFVFVILFAIILLLNMDLFVLNDNFDNYIVVVHLGNHINYYFMVSQLFV